MGKSYPAKTSFNGGVQSPLLRGLVDAPKGNSSFQASENMVPLKHGPLVRRGGTKFITTSDAYGGDGKKVQLVPFLYNDTDSYILEFSYSGSTGKLRVFKDNGIVLDSLVSTSVSNVAYNSLYPRLTVADSSDFAATDEVAITLSSGASELNGFTAPIRTIVDSTTIDLEYFMLPVSSTGAAVGTIDRVYTVETPYDGDDMFASDGTFRLDVVQYNDVMYIAHPDYQTRVLTRSADDVWTIQAIEYNNGPFLPDNAEKNKKLRISRLRREDDACGDSIVGYKYATVRSIVAGEAQTGESFDLFDASDVQAIDRNGLPSTGGTDTEGNGRYIAVFIPRYTTGKGGFPSGYRWHFMRIVKYISDSEVWVEKEDTERGFNSNTIIPDAYNINSINDGVDMRPDQWAMGAFSVRTGYPSVAEIHDGRLCLGNSVTEPTTIHFSEIGGFNTTSSTWKTADYDGQVYDDNGFSVSIGGGNQSPIQWISSSSDGVLVGSYNSEGVIGVSDSSDGFVPGGVSYRKSTSVGSKSIQPVMIDQSTLFVSRTGRRLHELTYNLASGGQKSPDLTLLAEHVTLTGVIDFAWQSEPLSTLWLVLSDGKLVGFTFDQNNEISAWHQHELGGFNDPNTSIPGVDIGTADSKVRTVAVIPSVDGLSDEVWLYVDRQVQGVNVNLDIYNTVVGTVEILSPIFDSDDDIKTAKCLDSYLTYSATIVSKTVTSGGTVSGLSDGDIYLVTNSDPSGTLNLVVDNTYFLYDGGKFKSLAGSTIDFGTSFTADTQIVSTTFTGFDIFYGKPVGFYADGRYLGASIPSITTGVLTLPDEHYAANITIGYPYTSYVELQNLEGGNIQNLNQGKTKRLKAVMVRLVDSLGLKYGKSSTDMYEYQFDEDDALSDFRTLKSGDYVLSPWPGGYDKSGTIRLQGDGPYPLQIQLVVAEMDTAEMFTSVR